MSDRTARAIELESSKVEFLEEVAKKYHLPDVGKAVRCLISYARENPDRHQAIFGEIRCENC